MQLRYFHLFPAVSMVLFGISLTQPAFICRNQISQPGWEILLIGWIGILVLEPRWLANAAVIYLWWWVTVPNERLFPEKINLWVALTAATAPFIPTAAGCPGGAGARAGSTGLDIGGHLWMASILVAVAGTFFVRGDTAVKEV